MEALLRASLWTLAFSAAAALNAVKSWPTNVVNSLNLTAKIQTLRVLQFHKGEILCRSIIKGYLYY